LSNLDFSRILQRENRPSESAAKSRQIDARNSAESHLDHSKKACANPAAVAAQT
jgi:hypothetical protein